MKYRTVLFVVIPIATVLGFGCFWYFSKYLFVNNEDTYGAAIVEYHAVSDVNLTAYERLNTNADGYIKVLNDIAKDVDIVVFSEATLYLGRNRNRSVLEYTTMVPSKHDHIIPCEQLQYNLFFRKLSCAAKTNKIYLVINVFERYNCEDVENSEKCKVYNTNVVFDREGQVIARYRKFNLYLEPIVTQPDPESVTFETDFGVTFGTFICFDILNKKPALDLVASGVKHIIFTTMWYGELPFLTALQMQNMWSYGNDVALLAAGVNNPIAGSGGSGIYQGRQGSLKTHFSDEAKTTVLMSRVQKKWDTSLKQLPEHKVNSWKHFNFAKNNFTGYTTEMLSNNSIIEQTLCSGNFCCKFTIMQEIGQVEAVYRMFTYHGLRMVGDVERGIEICALIACRTEDIATCGESFRSTNNLINYISVTATTTNTSSYYPNTLTFDYIPLTVHNFKWTQTTNTTQIELLQPHGGILDFGIFGRYYN